MGGEEATMVMLFCTCSVLLSIRETLIVREGKRTQKEKTIGFTMKRNEIAEINSINLMRKHLNTTSSMVVEESLSITQQRPS